MTTPPSDHGVEIRPIAESELDLWLSLEGDFDDSSFRGNADEAAFRRQWERGNRRPEWTWLAVRDGHASARAAWFGAPDHEYPWLLDMFDMGSGSDRLVTGEALLRATCAELTDRGAGQLEYELFLPPAWRDDSRASSITQDRTSVASAVGFIILTERLRFQWTSGTPLPPRSTRLEFRSLPEVGHAAFVDAVRRTYQGSLDAHTQDRLLRFDDERVAAEEIKDMRVYAAPEESWSVAYDGAGQLVGLIAPGGGGGWSIIGYVGVVPEQRGRGYINDLLAQATRFLAAQGAERIRADTDLTNTPMAAAFERAGYDNFAVRIDLVARTGPEG